MEYDSRLARGGRVLGVEGDIWYACQVFAGRLREVRHRVAGDDQSRVGLATAERVGGRVFAGVKAWIAARQVHPELVTRPPRHDVISAGDVAVSAHGLADEAGVGVHV